MRTDNAPTISRRDYQPYPYRLPNVELTLDLDAEQTRVHTRMEFERTDAQAQPLVLNGQDLQLEAIALNGQALTAAQYTLQDDTLTLLDRKSTRLNSSH